MTTPSTPTSSLTPRGSLQHIQRQPVAPRPPQPSPQVVNNTASDGTAGPQDTVPRYLIILNAPADMGLWEYAVRMKTPGHDLQYHEARSSSDGLLRSLDIIAWEAQQVNCLHPLTLPTFLLLLILRFEAF